MSRFRTEFPEPCEVTIYNSKGKRLTVYVTKVTLDGEIMLEDETLGPYESKVIRLPAKDTTVPVSFNQE